MEEEKAIRSVRVWDSSAQEGEEFRPKCYQGIIRCRPKNSEAMAMRSGAHGGLMCPLEKGVGGIKKERAELQGLEQSPNEKTRPGR